MALAALSGDEQRIRFTQLCNVLEPCVAVHPSSVSSELQTATEALLRQLRTDHGVAAALCRKVGMQSCKELREAKRIRQTFLRQTFLARSAAARNVWRRNEPGLSSSSSKAQAQQAPTACSGWRRGWAQARCRPWSG